MLGPKEKFQQRGLVIPPAPGDAVIISPASLVCMYVVYVSVCLCICVCVCVCVAKATKGFFYLLLWP